MSQHNNTWMDDLGLTEEQKRAINENTKKAQSFYRRHESEIKGVALIVGGLLVLRKFRRIRLGKAASKIGTDALDYSFDKVGEKTVNQLIGEGTNVFTMPDAQYRDMFETWMPYFYNTSRGRVMVQALPNFN